MKVTFCAYDTSDNIDGPTAWIKRLLPYLRENGIEVRILFFATEKKNLTAYNYFVNLGFECRIISWYLYYEEKVMAILDDIKNNPPDIFIPHYFAFACGAARWVQQCGIPTIMVLHNDNAFHYALVEEYAAKNTGYDVSAIVAVSKLMTEEVYKRTIRHDNIYFIPCGAPLSQEKVDAPSDKNIGLVYTGRIIQHQKRILDLAHAFCRVAKEIPGTTCNIYGSGLSEKPMKKILNTEGKGLRVNYGGKIESSLVQKYLLQNHIFVLLSDHEGLPIALMEAMGCGLVPVCSNIRSGITELIEDGKNGILVNDREDAFVEAVKILKEDPEKWRSMSVAASEKIATEYSEDICNKKWLNLLNELNEKVTPEKVLTIPSIKEIRGQVTLRKELKEYCQVKPFFLLIPYYKALLLMRILRWKFFIKG
jgi:colanic acid/amylovoran biosynthesis glycosyltransferase